MARMVAGDEEALAEAWQRHGAMVFGHARRLVGNAAVAEEVVQDVFVELWTHPDRYEPARGTLRAYLGVHARRRAIDALRRDRRRAAREERHVALEERPGGAPGDTGHDPQVGKAVLDAIQRLPDDQRRAVELAYFGGLTQCEVAQHLGIPEGTAKSRLRLAQTKLRSWLDPSLLELV